MKRIGILVLTVVVSLVAVLCCACAKQPFTVEFDGGGGTLVSGKEVQTVTSSSQLVPPIYEKTGYDQNGWNTILKEINDDCTVVALWKAKTFTLTFNTTADYSCDVEDIGVTYNSAVGEMPTPTWTGEGRKFFAGWKLDLGAGQKGDLIYQGMPWTYVEDKAVVADWNDKEFSITYNGITGATAKGDLVLRFNDDETFTIPRMEKEVYEFLGWKKGEDEPVKDFTVELGTRENLSLTAVWKKYDYKLIFKLSKVVRGVKIFAYIDGSSTDYPIYAHNGTTLGDRFPKVVLSKQDATEFKINGYLATDYKGKTVSITKDTVLDESIFGIKQGDQTKELNVYVNIIPIYTPPY